MTQKVQLLRSTTSGHVPATGGILPGELAVNLADKKLFIGDGAGVPIDLFNTYGTGTTIVAPIANTNVLHPVRSRLCVQTDRGTDTDPTHLYWNTVLGLYSETGGPASPGAPVSEDVALYVGGIQGGGGSRNAGGMWTLNTDIQRGLLPNPLPGVGPGPGAGAAGAPANCVDPASPTIGYELDFGNWDRDCPPGGPFTVGMFISTIGPYSSLAGIYYGAVTGSAPSWHNGIFFSGAASGAGAPNTVVDNTIFDASGSNVGYFLQGTHAVAAFYDTSTGSQSILITGTKTSQDIAVNTSSPTALHLLGSHGTATILDDSTGGTAISLTGTKTAQDIAIVTSSPAAINIAGGTHSAGAIAISSPGTNSIVISATNSAQAIALTGTAPAGINMTGTFSLAAITTANATTPMALAIKAGQIISLNSTVNQIKYDSARGKIIFTNNLNTEIASLDNSGNLRCLGTVTGSVTP